MINFSGKVLFLDRSDINTNEIIPAKYLSEISKEALKPYLLEDLQLDGFSPDQDIEGKNVIITRENFGCGSSREHAPWALETNNIKLVVAESFARIFRQNMFNCGMLAIELKKEEIDQIFSLGDSLDVGIDGTNLKVKGGGKELSFAFELNPFDHDLVKAGGWLEYARQNYYRSGRNSYRKAQLFS